MYGRPIVRVAVLKGQTNITQTAAAHPRMMVAWPELELGGGACLSPSLPLD